MMKLQEIIERLEKDSSYWKNNPSQFTQGRMFQANKIMEQLRLCAVTHWVACKDAKPIDGKEYLISDGEDVTEAQWYDDTKWGGMPYDAYTHFAEKPKPPCL